MIDKNRFISYSQNREDVLLWRCFKDIDKGLYIDVGALHPIIDSVTYAFYVKGWCGINIEPKKDAYELLERQRKRDTNINVAITNKIGQQDMYFLPKGLTTSNKSYAKKYTELNMECKFSQVQTKTLDAVVKDNNITNVHFLKIDVEGQESEVLQGFSFNIVRPWVLVIEATKPYSTIDSSRCWYDDVINKDYDLVYFDGMNKFFVAKEHSYLSKNFKTPVNFFDNYILYREIKLTNEINKMKSILNIKK